MTHVLYKHRLHAVGMFGMNLCLFYLFVFLLKMMGIAQRQHEIYDHKQKQQYDQRHDDNDEDRRLQFLHLPLFECHLRLLVAGTVETSLRHQSR